VLMQPAVANAIPARTAKNFIFISHNAIKNAAHVKHHSHLMRRKFETFKPRRF
jgi:hypothetical protein